MKKIIFPAVLVLFVLLTPVARAGYFYSNDLIGGPTNEQWVFFNGCSSTTCVVDRDSYATFLFGDFGVKQGAYYLTEPQPAHNHGKLVFKYQYRIQTEEDGDSTADTAYMKIKNVATNELYYQTVLTPGDANSDWQKERVVLPSSIVANELQVVFEVENDDQSLTTLGILNPTLSLKSEPVVRGTVSELHSGKGTLLDGVTVTLENKARTKVYQEVITDSSIYGDTSPYTFSFFPVPVMKKLVAVVEVNGIEKVIKIGKMRFGDYNSDLNIEF